MLDFSPVLKKEITIGQFCAGLTLADLRALTHEMIEAMLNHLAECVDQDVAFVSKDPAAPDKVGWSLGHVIAHSTASAEEAAFIAAELARGVPFEGQRSYYETPWETITTLAHCRQRLEESRRLRLTSLELWPDPPHLDNTLEVRFLEGPINAVARFAIGLLHEGMHLGQLAEIVRQARARRS